MIHPPAMIDAARAREPVRDDAGFARRGPSQAPEEGRALKIGLDLPPRVKDEPEVEMAAPARADAFRPLSADAEIIETHALESHHCRWPIDNEDGSRVVGYCGLRNGELFGYCPTHFRMAYPSGRTSRKRAA